jgi:hypothetical protein
MRLIGAEVTVMAEEPAYGHDYYGGKVRPERGYRVLPKGVEIQGDDKVFDVWAGWMETDRYHAKIGAFTRSRGRWSTWERPVKRSGAKR